MRTGAGTGYATIMTMNTGEAIVFQGSTQQNDGYNWMNATAWKSSTNSIVSGWAAKGNISTGATYINGTTVATSNTALNLYSSESDSTYTRIPQNKLSEKWAL